RPPSGRPSSRGRTRSFPELDRGRPPAGAVAGAGRRRLAGANSGRGCEVRFWSRSITRKETLNPSSSTSTCDRLTTLGGQPLRAEGLPANRPRVVGPERKYGT